MKLLNRIVHMIELDAELFRLEGNRLISAEDLRQVPGDKWLVTDFQEGMSRVMTVEGPAKYAELLVRRKLQESGEFEEPVTLFTHWKKGRGKNTTDIFFTAVPSRVTRYYLEELKQHDDGVLVFAMYGVLWNLLRRSGLKEPSAVVFRHHRFAEVLVGSEDQVYFANRCVAFDTEKDQINALWATVQSDIETVERDQRIQVSRIVHVNWFDAGETPSWPQEWQRRLAAAPQTALHVGDARHAVSWPHALQQQSARHSVSGLKEKLFYYAKCWAPAMNATLAVLTAALVVGTMGLRSSVNHLRQRTARAEEQIDSFQTNVPRQVLDNDFDDLLKFVAEMDRNRNLPSYQQVVDDMTHPSFAILSLHRLKVEYASDQVRMELAGKIDAPFDKAHEGYGKFLKRLRALGYRIEESRFETQISTSQIVLKLSRTAR